jgi:hypothetical protein
MILIGEEIIRRRQVRRGGDVHRRDAIRNAPVLDRTGETDRGCDAQLGGLALQIGGGRPVADHQQARRGPARCQHREGAQQHIGTVPRLETADETDHRPGTEIELLPDALSGIGARHEAPRIDTVRQHVDPSRIDAGANRQCGELVGHRQQTIGRGPDAQLDGTRQVAEMQTAHPFLLLAGRRVDLRGRAARQARASSGRRNRTAR